MIRLLRFTGWQIRLLAKYQILTVAFAIAAIYIALLLFLPFMHNEVITTFFVFMDPTGMGFIFIGVIILFEKGDNTLDAQVITPMETKHYLWSKALALLIPAIICSTAIAISTQGFHFRPVPFYLSLIFSSLIFTFLGIAGVIRVKTFNQYMIIIPLFLGPTFLPALNFFGLTDWKLLYIIPTQSTLNLFASSFSNQTHWTEILDIAYLGLWTYLSYYFARKEFEKKMYQ